MIGCLIMSLLDLSGLWLTKHFDFCSNGRCYGRRRVNDDRNLNLSTGRKFCLPGDICQVLCVLFGSFLFHFYFIVEVLREAEKQLFLDKIELFIWKE